MDDGNIPGIEWLEIFISEINKYNAEGISSYYTEENPFLNEIRKRRNFPNQAVINPNGFFGTGENCMYRKSGLEEVKKRNEFIFNFENKISQDIELALDQMVLN